MMAIVVVFVLVVLGSLLGRGLVSMSRAPQARPLPPDPARHITAHVDDLFEMNSDGTGRQERIARCIVGERVWLRREPGDSGAISVWRSNGEQLGVLRGQEESFDCTCSRVPSAVWRL